MDNRTKKEAYLFGSFFFLANKLQMKGDEFLGDENGMTLRQWFLTVMILQFDKHKPTLGEVAKLMGTSHQNTKQLANKLKENGFLTFQKDEKDGRVLRLCLTEKSDAYWKGREKDGNHFIHHLFGDVSDEEMQTTMNVFEKLLTTLEGWD
ncbi:MarR family winged helix-turn-helix transcriptional regulator [Salipaludibacillus daqingensis]|uniref:MarR family winged helix-turn-helix transcriptional regulator n=1 Tax=Salipaludibacillus daqingensis TaxID=3041001 RepID=UPI002474C4E5|nr:MarR family transcriptional regulator [Salipaludibacillus daqingensis]